MNPPKRKVEPVIDPGRRADAHEKPRGPSGLKFAAVNFHTFVPQTLEELNAKKREGFDAKACLRRKLSAKETLFRPVFPSLTGLFSFSGFPN